MLTTRLSPPAARYQAGPLLQRFYDAVLERVRALPGVEAASVVDWVPLSGFGASIGFTVPERDGEAVARSLAELRVVDGDYFTTLRIPLVAGRVFERGDRNGAPRLSSSTNRSRALNSARQARSAVVSCSSERDW